MRQRAVLALVTFFAAAQMTMAQSPSGEPPLAPDRFGTNDGALPVPQIDQTTDVPLVMPPDVPPRPPLYPAPNMVPASISPPPNVLVKAPLSWRAKALQLRTATQSKGAVLNTTFDDAVMTLLATLPQCGMRMVALNSKAGELLAAPADGQPRPLYVFIFSETSPGQVQVRGATTYTGKSANPQTNVQRVLDSLPTNLKGPRR